MNSIQNKKILIVLKNNTIVDVVADKGIVVALLDVDYPEKDIGKEFKDLYTVFKTQSGSCK
jgi:hypothetical protein